jgi:membrane-associated phospholipid phosphatase
MKSAVHQRKANSKFIGTTTALLIGVVLLLVAYFCAKNGQITGWELTVFRFFNDAPNWLVTIFGVITFLGTVVALVLAVAILLIIKRYGWAFKLFLAGGTAWLAATLLKLLEIRARPYDLLSGVHLAESKDLATGFPSAHTAMAAAIATILITKNTKNIIWLLIVAVLLVAISRIVVGMHAPLDVIGGMGVGIIVASAVNYLAMAFIKQRQSKAKLKNGDD